MSDAQRTSWYPAFRPGQVMTAEELNRLRDFILEESRIEHRDFDGHGVVWGLNGRVRPEEARWELSPGRAVDRRGRVITVRQPVQIDPCHPDFTDRMEKGTHALVGPVPGSAGLNFTPFLVYRQEEIAEECKPHGPDISGRRMSDSFVLTLVPGRLKRPPVPTFYDLQPLRLPPGLRLESGVRFSADFYTLRDQLLAGLESTPLRATAHSRLKSLTLAGAEDSQLLTPGDLTAVAVLNDIVYTGWQYARANEYRALHAPGECGEWMADDEDSASGIALGWLYQNRDGVWRWDENWRHQYQISLLHLSHIQDYPCERIMHACLERVAAVLEASDLLAARPEGSAHPGAPATPRLTCVSRGDQEGGTGNWLAGAGWTAPRRWACFWPLDPLRGSDAAPVVAAPPCPLETDTAGTVDPDETPARRLSPSLFEPANDPYFFGDYAEGERIDPSRTGLLALSGLLAHPLNKVIRALTDACARHGFPPTAIGEPIAHDDVDRLAGLRYCLVVSFVTNVYCVYDRKTRVVIGFACEPGTPRERLERTRAIASRKSARRAKRDKAEKKPGFWRRVWQWLAE